MISLTIPQLLAQTNSADVRVRIAIDRLGYARRLFQVGPPELQQILHIEKKYCADSWLDGLTADLQWLQHVLPPSVLPAFSTDDFSGIIDLWQGDQLPWKSLLRRALRRHKLQEEIMADVKTAHDRMLRRLRASGASFAPDVEQVFGVEREAEFPCSCGRRFATAQGLALHRLKAHGIHAPSIILSQERPALLAFSFFGAATVSLCIWPIFPVGVGRIRATSC